MLPLIPRPLNNKKNKTEMKIIEVVLNAFSLMEFQTIFKEDLPLLSNHHLKTEPDPEIEDYFPIQDLHELHNFSLAGPSFHPDYGIDVSGYDPFGPFSYGLPSDDLEFKPFEMENGCGVMQNCMGRPSLTHLGKNCVDVFEPDRFMHVGDPTQDLKWAGFLIPDEESWVTGETGIKKSNGNPCKGKKKINSSKGQWTKEEDRVLKTLVEKYGGRKWSYIAQMLKGRIGKQCRERWHNHLRPNIKKDFWTEEEDRILITAHAEVGNKWSEIAKRLPGRTENSIKNHWNATKRRQYTKRKCRSKWPKPSPILQNYIRSLNLPPGKSSMNSNKLDNPSAFVKSLSSSQNQYEFHSTDRLVPDFDLPEFAFDEKLLEGDSIESLLDEIPMVNCSGSGGGGGEEEKKKQLDLMEMMSQVNF